MLRRLGAEIYLREMWRREVVSWPCSSTNTPLPQTDPLLHEARNLLKQKLICEWFCGSKYLFQGVDLREIEASRLSSQQLNQHSTSPNPLAHLLRWANLLEQTFMWEEFFWVDFYLSRINVRETWLPPNFPMLLLFHLGAWIYLSRKFKWQFIWAAIDLSISLGRSWFKRKLNTFCKTNQSGSFS